jgi:hypothetical protein
VTELTARDHSYTVPNLKEGDEVSFRVRAVNAVGVSEPSRATDAAIVQDQPGSLSSHIQDVFIMLLFRKAIVLGYQWRERYYCQSW